MTSAKRELEVKESLTTLCLRCGWSYAAFWRFDQRNSMLLTLEDAYVDEIFRAVIDDTFLQLHMLGQGTVGKAALEGKHRWIFSPTKCNLIAETLVEEDSSDLSGRFCSGIETVAVIPVDSYGVIEFGSAHEILESSTFLDQARQVIRDICIFAGLALPENNATSSLNHDMITADDGLLACLYESLHANPNPTMLDGEFYTDVKDTKFDPFQLFEHVMFDVGPNYQCEQIEDNQPVPYDNSSGTGIGPDSLDTFENEGWFDPSEIIRCQLTDAFACSYFSLSKELVISDNDLLQAIGIDSSLCSQEVLVGNTDNISNCNQPAMSSQTQSCVSNSLNNTYSTLKSSSDLPSPNNASYFKELGAAGVLNHRCMRSQETFIESITELQGGLSASIIPPPQTRNLFSQLGLDQIISTDKGTISSSSFANSSIEFDQFSEMKKRKLESCSPIGSITEDDVIVGSSSFNSSKQQCFFPKTHVWMWVNDSSNENSSTCITKTQPKMSQETSKKATAKRAKPGESSRPRPKDRQMIQDRIKELRNVIPNSAKCSIDSLLGRTIKHMLFLQGLTKYEEKLTQVDNFKQTQRDDCSGKGGISNFAAWAVEVDGQNPIIVEDIDQSGLMLIEMLCEDQGFFLEIADVIRGFGLTILEGVIDVREGKIWAHFIAEAYKRQATRMELLIRLVQLFQEASSSSRPAAVMR